MARFRRFLWLSNIPLYMYHIFFIHSSIDGHLGCFYIFAIVHDAAVNIGMHISFWIRDPRASVSLVVGRAIPDMTGFRIQGLLELVVPIGG